MVELFNDEYKWNSIKDKLVLAFLAIGIICFGFLLPDSFSDHNKIVHFAAHFGMSFLIASILYAICSIKLRISKKTSYILLIASTLILGSLYKYLEIAGEGILHAYDFGTLLHVTGCYTSMSQNIAGLMAAILTIKYFFDKHLIVLPVNRHHKSGYDQRINSVNEMSQV